MTTHSAGAHPETHLPDVDHRPVPRQRQVQVPANLTAAVLSNGRVHKRAPRVDPRAPATQIDQLVDDFQRAQSCRRYAEDFRDQWSAGRAHEIAHVVERARVGDNRFKSMTTNELNTIGRVRWTRSVQARKLLSKEESYIRWAQTYLAFAEFQLRLLTTSDTSRRSAEAWSRLRAVPETPFVNE